MAERHRKAAQAPRPRRTARATYKEELTQRTRDAIPNWQEMTTAELSRVISRKLQGEKPGQWKPATIRSYLKKLG